MNCLATLVSLAAGPPGAGKSTLGRHLQSANGFRFEDGDHWLPSDMLVTLEKGCTFSHDQRDRFADIIVERLKALKRQEKRPLAIAQALLKSRHRALVRAAHPDMLFVRAHADSGELCRRLRQGGNLVDDHLGIKMNDLLEVDPQDPVVDHGRPESVFLQLEAILRDAGFECIAKDAAIDPAGNGELR